MIIYKAQNNINNKIYIGQTTQTLESRANQHYRDAKCKKKKHPFFHEEIIKYGFNNFTFIAIDFTKDPQEADDKERFWISFFDSSNSLHGYNLDSGGIRGGNKSEATKEKIGKTTIEKWNDKETAEKMKAGLKKGAETMKRNAKRCQFTCPICRKTLFLPKWEVKKRKFCSQQCSAIGNNWQKGLKAASQKNHEKNIELKKRMREDIEEWIYKNENKVASCPKNAISTTLNDLMMMIKDKYNIKDWRSIFICFDVKNKKELLDSFKKLIIISKENIC